MNVKIILTAIITCVAHQLFGWQFLLGGAVGIVITIWAFSGQEFNKSRYVGGYEELCSEYLNIDNNSDWMTLGLWKNNCTYIDACKNMSFAIGTAASLSEIDTVVDVGFGRGEQCVFWFEKFKIKRLIGVNISPAETAHAIEKMNSNQIVDQELHVGSATDLSFIPKSAVTKVLSVDSAYHYSPSRELFFQEANRILSSGGMLATADIVCQLPLSEWSYGSKLLLRLVCWQTSLPFPNMISKSEYIDSLKSCGFENIQCRSVGGEVFPGFSSFVTRHSDRYKHITSPIVRSKYLMVSNVSKYIWNNNVLDYIIVSAVKE